MNNSTLFSKVLDAATVTAGRILRSRNGYTEINVELFAQCAEPIYSAAIDTLLAEWSEAIKAIVSDETLRQFVNAQAFELGNKVAESYHDEMVWMS